MSDISEYFSQQDRIKELEVELAELVLVNKKLKQESLYKNRYKRMYKILIDKKLLTNKSRAVYLIKAIKGSVHPKTFIKLISDYCFLSENTINGLWYKSWLEL